MAKELLDGVTSALHDEVRGLRSTVHSLKSDTQALKDENAKLKSLQDTSSSGLHQLHKQNDDLKQYTRRNSVRISGLPELPDESTDEIVLSLSKDLKAGITVSDIDRSHRVGPASASKSRSVIVKFATYNARARFMKNRKLLKSKQGRAAVYINEDLTKARNKLLYEARSLVKTNSLSGAWFSDGRIFVKSLSGTRSLITSLRDLQSVTRTGAVMEQT